VNKNDQTRRKFLKTISAYSVALSLFGVSYANVKKMKKPNIILVLTDDLGWADTSVRMMKDRSDSKSNIYQTPNLERMAKQSMIFSNAYSSSPVCSPTRDSILYGKTPARLHHSILLGKAKIEPEALTIPRVMKKTDSAYITAHFGKRGCSPKTPEEAGYDVSDGDTDNWHGDWRNINGKKQLLPANDPKRIFSVTKRVCSFIEHQVKVNRPFYIQISHYAVHVNHYALEETINKYRQAGLDESAAKYAAMIENLDTGLGKLLDKIDELNIIDNTYIIFTSDNGAGDNNGPLKGGKASLWEGGIRIPTVVQGPGIQAGTYCDIPIVGWDFLPTFKHLAGDSTPLPDDFDGGSLHSLFEKVSNGIVKRDTKDLIFHYPWFDSLPMSAIRRDDFKLVKDLNTNETRLFNLAHDIGETTDVMDSNADIAEEMRQTLEMYLNAVNAEKIENLRNEREETLHKWIKRDEQILGKLEKQIIISNDPKEKIGIKKEYDMIKKRIQGQNAALDRVAKGRLMKAW